MDIKEIFNEEKTIEEEIIALYIKYKNETDNNNKLKILKKIETLRKEVKVNGSVK